MDDLIEALRAELRAEIEACRLARAQAAAMHMNSEAMRLEVWRVRKDARECRQRARARRLAPHPDLGTAQAAVGYWSDPAG